MRPLNALICLFILSLGCSTIPMVTTTVTRVSNSMYEPKPSTCEIKILTQMPADSKYEELAILNAITDTGTFTHKDLNVMLPSLKAKACELGADAIVIKNVDQGGAPMHNKYNSQTPSKVFCVAIKLVSKI